MAAIASAATNGAWDDPASWSPQQVPTAGDVVTIGADHSVRVSNMVKLAGMTIEINATGELLFSGRSHNIYR